ncbi:hypothetical protein CROQUDRAFT_96542 [Cronartium quercuum f. sp. fusiforme G11]|uniref:Uncharacterized protein n=1 Tax=Cronartium quercuum f. sp. fusiforme G11 TaxID=708437 RepID=A0A9P6T8M4_9BASI|nr:hypothetical protein CROQUDRAFT_96542 [Cronartium quercuum f. sp. fusiforme G11]
MYLFDIDCYNDELAAVTKLKKHEVAAITQLRSNHIHLSIPQPFQTNVRPFLRLPGEHRDNRTLPVYLQQVRRSARVPIQPTSIPPNQSYTIPKHIHSSHNSATTPGG